MVPGWVAECCWHSRLPARPDDKCAFLLQPAPVRPPPLCTTAGVDFLLPLVLISLFVSVSFLSTHVKQFSSSSPSFRKRPSTLVI